MPIDSASCADGGAVGEFLDASVGEFDRRHERDLDWRFQFLDRDIAVLNAQAYALDSTTIDLCLKLFPWAHFRRRKAGVKAHTLLDLRVGIPVFLRMTHAKTHDLMRWIRSWPKPGRST